ncbi:MAG: SGNH/GDSL hydrolase family protein [Microbacterium sp.]|uniref:SGNH/GDSL hydrolase family protein n=1 Tax=Microbacterium sp. TaxID=51671 RepID=UPI003F7CE0CA
MAHNLVFTGDSITDSGRRDSSPPLGHGYVALIADQLKSAAPAWSIINTGIAGTRTRDLRERWLPDIEAVSPDVLSILIGINDVWRRFSDDDPTDATDFETTYRTLLTQAVASGSPALVLCEPFLLPVSDDQQAWFSDLNPKRGVVRALASEFGARFLPLQELLSDDAGKYGTDALTTDGVHLTATGHRLLANHWMHLSLALLSRH